MLYQVARTLVNTVSFPLVSGGKSTLWIASSTGYQSAHIHYSALATQAIADAIHPRSMYRLRQREGNRNYLLLESGFVMLPKSTRRDEYSLKLTPASPLPGFSRRRKARSSAAYLREEDEGEFGAFSDEHERCSRRRVRPRAVTASNRPLSQESCV